MKKHNEGYTLVLVLVVMLVMSLLCTVTFTAAMQNLKFQKITAQRMSDTYAAEGELEKVTARLETAVIDPNSTYVYPVQVVLLDADDDKMTVEPNGNTLTIKIRSGRVELDCVLTLTGQNGAATVIEDKGGGMYSITNLTQIQYTHYEIFTVEEVAADNALEDYKERPTDAEYTSGE